MVGVLRELYSTYGIALLKDLESKSESITLNVDITKQLIHKNIQSLSVGSYIENVDYVVDYEKGTITSLSTGSIPDGEVVTVQYTYYVFVNESDTLNLEIFPYKNKTIYSIGINPYTLNSVTYQGNILIEDRDYFVYNGKFELPSEPNDLRKPYQLNLTIGFDEIPNDLKMAFYELINLRFERRRAKADLISRIEDNNGATTTYKEGSIPKHLHRIFCYYTGRNYASN